MGSAGKLLPAAVSIVLALIILGPGTSLADGNRSLVQAVPPPDSTLPADKTVITERLSTTQVAGARLAPPHRDYGIDEDGDGLVETLIVEVAIEVFVADAYGIRGTLRDSTGSNYIAYWSVGQSLVEVGMRDLDLSYPGELIMQSGIDGPYLINDLALYQVPSFEDLDHGEHTTQAYLYTEFEVAATLVPPSAPRSLTALSRDTHVSLSWQSPEQNGTSQVDWYRIYRGTESEVLSLQETLWWEVVYIGNGMTNGATFAYNDTGLTNGVTYYYQVSACNHGWLVLEGPRSAEVSATPIADDPSPSEDDSSTGRLPPLLAALLVGGAVLASSVVGAVYVLGRRRRDKI